jgi:hypothetical protein
MDTTASTAFRTTLHTSAEQALAAHKEAVAFAEEQLAFAEKQTGAAFEAMRGLFTMQARAAQSFGRVWVDALKPTAH